MPTPIVLLLHDGELTDVREILDKVGAVCLEWIGSATRSYEFTPWDLVIATGDQISNLDVGDVDPKPVRIAILSKESEAHDLGCSDADYIVRRPVHPTALRLLIEHLLYNGPEQRTSKRVAVGVPVQFRTGLRRKPATLVDLSTGGCRLLSDHPAPFGGRVAVYFPKELDDGKPFTVRGRVMRSETGEGEHAGVEIVSIRFDESSAAAIGQLRNVVELHVHGPSSFDGADALLPRPETNGSEFYDGEIVPEDGGNERRLDTRVAYPRKIISLGEGPARVLIGRDLSIGGMWVEATPWLELGNELRLALHARAGQQPVVVEACVDRGNSTDGFAVLFRNMTDDMLSQLTVMLDVLPDIDTHGESNSRIVVTSIVEDESE